MELRQPVGLALPRVVRAAEQPSSRERRPRAFAACTGFHGFFFAYRAAASANSLSARGSICFTSASTCSGVGAARDGLRCRAQSIS